MHEFRKLYSLLQMIGLLGSSNGYTVQQLAKKYEVSTRTIYRYFDLLKTCGFELENTGGRYRAVKGENYFDHESVKFSLEEAAILRDAMLSMHSSHPLKNQILTRLILHSELGTTAEMIYDSILGKNVAAIASAIRQKRQVLLKNYHSLNSNTVKDRLVEPIGFIQNMRYFTAYDIKEKKVKQFKPDRVQEVEITEIEFQHGHLHAGTHPDAFGMNSAAPVPVELKLSDRAASLLREEFPLAANGISGKGKNGISWNGTVKGWEGIGRFILGLPGEVEVNSPRELEHYLEKRKSVRRARRV